jgi:hypothetical protein
VADQWRSRIVRRDTCDPRELQANPENWRIHPRQQVENLEAVMDRVGWVDEVMWNERTGRMIDGHARVEIALRRGEREVPRLVVDLSEEEERLVLATFDPLGAMAATDWEKLERLVEDLPDVARLWEEHNRPENIEDHWRGMPEYSSEDKTGIKIVVHFETEEDVSKFREATGCPVTSKTKATWFPYREDERVNGIEEYSAEP